MEFLRQIFAPGSTSEQFRVNMRDFIKGLAVAAFSTPITIITQSLEAGHFSFDWRAIGIVAVTSGASYLMKNFFSPAPKL